ARRLQGRQPPAEEASRVSSTAGRTAARPHHRPLFPTAPRAGKPETETTVGDRQKCRRQKSRFSRLICYPPGAHKRNFTSHDGGTMNQADTAWMLISTALVLLMTPALAFFYGGLVRSKNALN